MLPQMHRLVCDSILAARPMLLRGLAEAGRGRDAQRRGPLDMRPSTCVLWGFDFMITDEGRAYVIEVNGNPMMSEQCEWHATLVDRMMHDWVELALDARYPPARPVPPPPVDGVEVEHFDGSGWLTLLRAGDANAAFAARAGPAPYDFVLERAEPETEAPC